MAELTLDLIKHNGPTPADVMTPQIISDLGNFTLDFKQLGFCASPVFLWNGRQPYHPVAQDRFPTEAKQG